jgi:glyoxylase-like metal-dependent hydrolase (beta-lactamase superfamily II)
MGNAESQGKVVRGTKLSFTFRIPHSAFRILVSHTTFRVGRLTCHALEAGSQRLDGGAMFGVVPKPLWQRRVAPDDRNRIPLALRCLLVEHDAGLVLIDTGLGNKEDDKFKDIYAVANAGANGRTLLEDALAELGHRPEDVAWVINTHLHFDHAGGNTYRTGGTVRITFPRAKYLVQKGELEFARHTNERTAASYLAHNFEPVAFTLLDGPAEPLPGIRCLLTPGHVPYHQSVLLESGGERACFLADLVPTTAHLPLPWIMGYDVQPLVTLESRRALYARAEAEGWLLVFEHDPDIVGGHLGRDGKAFGLVDPLRAD